MNQRRDPSDTLSAAIRANAPKLLEGGEYFGKEDYVVDQLAEHYDEPKDDVRKKLRAAVDKVPKAKVNAEDKAKKEAAVAARTEANEAAEFAKEAAEDAKRKSERAAALEAEAEGKVPVEVPVTFQLNIGGVIHRIEKGTPRLPREHAEHAYAQSHGVRIIGNGEQAKA